MTLKLVLGRHSYGIWKGNPTGREVFLYGKQLGEGLQNIIGVIAGGGAAIKLTSKLAKVAPKALKAIEKAAVKAAEAAEGAGQLRFAPGKWLSHFEKHGSEMGYRTSVEYLRGAQSLSNAPAKGSILRGVRNSGDVVTFNRATNEFVVVTPNEVIRTFFKPDPRIHGYSTNIDYFYAQFR